MLSALRRFCARVATRAATAEGAMSGVGGPRWHGASTCPAAARTAYQLECTHLSMVPIRYPTVDPTAQQARTRRSTGAHAARRTPHTPRRRVAPAKLIGDIERCVSTHTVMSHATVDLESIYIVYRLVRGTGDRDARTGPRRARLCRHQTRSHTVTTTWNYFSFIFRSGIRSADRTKNCPRRKRKKTVERAK